MVRLFDAARRPIVPWIVVPRVNLPAGGEYGWFLMFLIVFSPLNVISEFVMKQRGRLACPPSPTETQVPAALEKGFSESFLQIHLYLRLSR